MYKYISSNNKCFNVTDNFILNCTSTFINFSTGFNLMHIVSRFYYILTKNKTPLDDYLKIKQMNACKNINFFIYKIGRIKPIFGKLLIDPIFSFKN